MSAPRSDEQSSCAGWPTSYRLLTNLRVSLGVLLAAIFLAFRTSMPVCAAETASQPAMPPTPPASLSKPQPAPATREPSQPKYTNEALCKACHFQQNAEFS